VYLTPAQQRMQQYLCRLADCVLVNATAVRTWLVAGGAQASRITVIPNGVNMTRFPAPDVDGPRASRIRAEFGFDAGCPLVVVVARLSKAKGLDHLIDAAPAILAARPDTRFLLVGPDDWGNRARLEARVHALGLDARVRFAGDRADVPAILAEASVSVLPSLSEAMPNGVLESMAAGAPVVATRVGGIPEAIEDGRNGLLVPPADPAALATAIGRLLSSPDEARRFARAARATIVDRFSLEQMVRSTSLVYERLAARPRLAPLATGVAVSRKA